MIRVEHHPTPGGGIALVLVDRREKKNALTPDMLENLRAAIERVHEERGDTRVLLLAGEGGAFCSGFDLSLCRTDPLAMSDLLTRLSRAIRAMRSLPVPVVIAAHTAAIAGGCALLTGADFVVTDAAAQIGYPVVRLGVSPAVSGPTLALAVGSGHARERMLDPALFDGREAVRIGLAHEVVERPEDVRPRAMEVARALAAKPPDAVAATKWWFGELEGADRDGALERALAASLAIAGGPEERARLEALWKG